MMEPNSTRPEPIDPLEVKGWVSRVRLEEHELLVSEPTNRRRQGTVARPEPRRRAMLQRSVDFPAS
jgi:hypothetical protein